MRSSNAGSSSHSTTGAGHSAGHSGRAFTRLPQCGEISEPLGRELSGLSVLVLDRVDLLKGNRLLFDILDLVADRGIPDVCIGAVSIAAGDGVSRDYVAIKQKLERNMEAIVALRVAPKSGKDAEVSWTLYARTLKPIETAEGIKVFLLMSGVAVLIWVLCGQAQQLSIFIIAAIIAGALIWLSRRPTQSLVGSMAPPASDTFTQTDASVLGQAVDYCLMQALAANGVNPNQMRILRQSKQSGMGQA